LDSSDEDNDTCTGKNVSSKTSSQTQFLNINSSPLKSKVGVDSKIEEITKIESKQITPKKELKPQETNTNEKNIIELSDEDMEVVDTRVEKKDNQEEAVTKKELSIKSRHSSASSSSSSSSSNSSSSSSSISSILSTSSQNTPESKIQLTTNDKVSLDQKNTLEFSLSDDEYSDAEVDEQISVSKISLSFNTTPDSKEKANQSQIENSQENVMLSQKEKQEKDELDLKEKLLQQESEKKLDALVDAYTARQQEILIEDLLAQVTTESKICEFIRDKLLTDEINTTQSVTSNMLRNICIRTIEEERQEMKMKEKQLKKEMREKFEAEIVETLINEITGNLMRECCERVIWEMKNERVTSIYEDILDEVVRKMIDRSFLDFIFDEMIVKDKPLIKKPEPIKLVEKPVTIPSSDKKRRLLTSPVTSQSRDNADLIQTPAKKICTSHLSLEMQKPSEPMNKRSEDTMKQTKNSNESSANLTESKFECLFDDFL
jgi:hypothetical protein